MEVFEAKNWINLVDQNVMSVIRFFSGPVKFTLGWLGRMDKLIRQHLTVKGLLMKRGMASSRPFMNPDDMGMGLKTVSLSTSSSSSDSSSSTSGEPSSDANGSGGWRS